MKIRIGNNNTIKKSNIGNNKIEAKENIITSIIIPIITGLIIAGIVFYLGWN